jgi:hypothetical protein
MRGVYESGISIASLAAAKTLLYLTAPSSKVLESIGTNLGDSGSNVTNQQLKALWQRITTLGTPTATAITPTPTEKGDQASGATVAGNVTASEPTYGAGLTIGQRGFSSLGGYDPAFLPEERFYIAPGDSWGLRMISTPTAFDCEVSNRHREIG